MAQQYNDPVGNQPSSIGTQARTDYYYKKALIAIRTKQYFMPLSNVRAMPRNKGKRIKQDVYVPLLDERNVNDQGIDAAGTVITTAANWYVWAGGMLVPDGTIAGNAAGFATELLAKAAVTADGQSVLQGYGNLYGSSKDVGAIAAKIPALTENGGRVNRVGFTRLSVQADIYKRGFFHEYTQASMDFDSDSELLSHITEEALVGANELTEAELQTDLITSATANGTVYFTGEGIDKLSVDGVVTYVDLMNLSIALDNNKTPKTTTVISGSRMIDTRTINGGRIMFVGSELIPAIEAMTDLHGNPAFISVEKYANAGNTVNGEVGSVRQFRIVVVPDMQYTMGGGAQGIDTPGDGSNGVDIYPMLVVGDGAFVTIGFQTDGKTVKFVINHKGPGKDIASLDDPYGEKGFYSIKWWYGYLALRPERLGIIWTTANPIEP